MHSEVVAGCSSGGEILIAQTTFVEIVCNRNDGQSRFRIHYKGKREVNVKPGHFKSLQTTNDHPLLLQYLEPSETIYLSSRVHDKRQFTSLLEDAAREHFEGWRSLYAYINPEFTNRLDEFLDGGFGILMEAPISFSARVLSIAQSVGINLHSRPGKARVMRLQLLLMDEYFTIAESFRISRIDESST